LEVLLSIHVLALYGEFLVYVYEVELIFRLVFVLRKTLRTKHLSSKFEIYFTDFKMAVASESLFIYT